jgi:hypothetical protein
MNDEYPELSLDDSLFVGVIYDLSQPIYLGDRDYETLVSEAPEAAYLTDWNTVSQPARPPNPALQLTASRARSSAFRGALAATERQAVGQPLAKVKLAAIRKHKK